MSPRRARSGHLVSRFFGMLDPRSPDLDDVRWVTTVLGAGELELWARMRRADRRHSIGVARRVERALGDEATRPVVAAALCHDLGKIDSALGVYGRVVATVCAMVADEETIDAWRRSRGFVRRVGLYLQHPRIGAEMLALAGADPLTVAWTAEHHLPEDRWTLPPHLGRALKDADDD